MIHYEDERITLHHGDALEVLRGLPDASVDSVVTDPPYGLEFMGKEWDAPWKQGEVVTVTDAKTNGVFATKGFKHGVRFSRGADEMAAFGDWCQAWATECLRVLKPGGHLLAFGGTRTWHRLAAGIEDAGFEIRDSIAWLYGSGFPKSLNVSKAIDKAAGMLANESTGLNVAGKTDKGLPNPVVKGYTPPAPATPDAAIGQGWGTALKPAHEPVCVARKPLIGTVAANVLAHGTGALNIDATRIGTNEVIKNHSRSPQASTSKGIYGDSSAQETHQTKGQELGRWPTNVVLDDFTADLVDQQSGERPGGQFPTTRGASVATTFASGRHPGDSQARSMGDSGGASRFFYVAKAPAKERPKVDGTAHPTVKPLALMRWLVRLVTPPGGTVLEPFAGSGTTVEACLLEGVRVVAIEREADYLPLIEARIARQVDQQLALDA